MLFTRGANRRLFFILRRKKSAFERGAFIDSVPRELGDEFTSGVIVLEREQLLLLSQSFLVDQQIVERAYYHQAYRQQQDKSVGAEDQTSVRDRPFLSASVNIFRAGDAYATKETPFLHIR